MLAFKAMQNSKGIYKVNSTKTILNNLIEINQKLLKIPRKKAKEITYKASKVRMLFTKCFCFRTIPFVKTFLQIFSNSYLNLGFRIWYFWHNIGYKQPPRKTASEKWQRFRAVALIVSHRTRIL